MRSALIAATPLMIAGCATLPSSGPTAHDIVRDQKQLADFAIVDVDRGTIATLAAQPEAGVGRFAAMAHPGDVDRIGSGDTLQISVYEVGATLFGGRSPALDTSLAATSAAENFPPIVVAHDGGINVPYMGRLMVAGKTPDEVAAEISQGLRRSSENPQAVVSIRENVSNTFVVQGDVHKPGRFPLTLARERLLDAIAIAGGSSDLGVDSVVQLDRGGHLAEAPLSAIDPGSPDDVEMLPQDRVAIIYRPRTFVTLGASGKVGEVPFQAKRVSLAEALGRSSGPSDQAADPSAIFVFRYEPAAFDGSPLANAKPVAYRVNMRAADGYFLAQRFEMRPRDVVYVANADSNLPTKAVQILSLFFSPFYTAKVVAQ